LLVRIGEPPAQVVIDPFNGGTVAAPDTIATLYARASSRTPTVLPAMSNREMLVRLLLNQASRAQHAGDLERALDVRSRMTAMAPQLGQLWWDRAEVERQLGQIGAARGSLSAMLEVTRDPNERQRIRATLDALARSIN
jgi:regulator of sirC expression with transglutaminase-like and TPR domain